MFLPLSTSLPFVMARWKDIILLIKSLCRPDQTPLDYDLPTQSLDMHAETYPVGLCPLLSVFDSRQARINRKGRTHGRNYDYKESVVDLVCLGPCARLSRA